MNSHWTVSLSLEVLTTIVASLIHGAKTKALRDPQPSQSNTFVNDILSGVDDLKTVISRGLDYNTTSLAFRVPDKDSEHISKTLVGNHKNHNKKGICTTLVKAAFHNEVALESAGFRSFPDRLMPWVGFTMFNKCTYSSAGLVPQWWKGFRPSKKDWELIKRIAADWDANPRPKVMASTVVPTQFPRHFFHWPAISAPSETIPTTSTTSAAECSGNERSPKCPRIDSSAGSLSEPILYNWFGDNSNASSPRRRFLFIFIFVFVFVSSSSLPPLCPALFVFVFVFISSSSLPPLCPCPLHLCLCLVFLAHHYHLSLI
ncbi:hypothetical protein BS47DRAFT_1401699 [Hydnum rufescens UP504]|uniref:Uncharacterized protein n=1 Tax=Hydnum rufescens UP504 TaxID=1448309 RepID=A0A9P6ADZ0_9AGAM|nr:hypothetical protein BS47DRAFT_1401699 [Hydnum rufescens UP504]